MLFQQNFVFILLNQKGEGDRKSQKETERITERERERERENTKISNKWHFFSRNIRFEVWSATIENSALGFNG